MCIGGKSIYRVQHYLHFQASTWGLKNKSPADKGDYYTTRQSKTINYLILF